MNKMHPLSLKWRIGICVTILTLIIVTIISVTAYFEFREALFDFLDYRLKSDIGAIKLLLYAEDSTEEIKKEVSAVLRQEARSSSSGYKIWWDSGETYLSSPDFMDSILRNKNIHNNLINSDHERILDIFDHEKRCRAIFARYTGFGNNFKADDVLNVLIYTSSDKVYHETEEFLLELIILASLIIWFSIGFTAWILRWGLKPVDNITDLMDNTSGKILDYTDTNFPAVPQELSPFVRAWGQMLDRLSKTMREQRRFTSDASHELRTPLATIKSTLQLARSQNRPDEYYKSAIDQSLEDLERLNQLIDQLLQLSHLDNDTYLQDSEVIDIHQLIAEVCEHYSIIAQQNDHTLKYTLCHATITGHEQLIRQLIANLIDNAIKYSPKKSTISVSMEKNEGQLKIKVHDEGGNISENDQHLIFERFYRLDKARNRKTGGAGIGLSIAREIAQKHDGDITVSSNPKDGTNFIITLPI